MKKYDKIYYLNLYVNELKCRYKCKRFHVLRTEWGVTKFIDIDTNPSNGLSDGRYLCVWS